MSHRPSLFTWSPAHILQPAWPNSHQHYSSTLIYKIAAAATPGVSLQQAHVLSLAEEAVARVALYPTTINRANAKAL